MKKIFSFLVGGILLLTSVVSVGVIADNQNISVFGNTKSSDNSVTQIFSYIEEQNNLNPNTITFLEHVRAIGDDGMIFPGYYYFAPCDSIDIEGDGIVGIGEEEVAVALLNGTANLDGTFSHEYKSDEIISAILFYDFSGEIEGGPDEGPISLVGTAESAEIVEVSVLAFLWLLGEYKQGRPISVKLNSLTEDDIEMVNPHFYIYRYENEAYQLVYDKLIQATWDIPPLPFSKSWVWDQKDNGGSQVPIGEYVVALTANINGKDHPFHFDFEIIKSGSRNMRSFQILIQQILAKIFS